MPPKVRDNQLPTIRVSPPLRRELEAAAAEDGRSLSDLVRRVLVNFAEQRLAAREELAA